MIRLSPQLGYSLDAADAVGFADAAGYRAADADHGGGAEAVHVEIANVLARAEREERVAVRGQMRRSDGERQAVVGADASLFACVLDKSAFVATTPIVVFCPALAWNAWKLGSVMSVIESSIVWPSSASGPAITRPVSGSTTPPTELTATIAPTVSPPPSSTFAAPMPPFRHLPRPSSLATVAPAPAPSAAFGDEPGAGGGAGEPPVFGAGPDRAGDHAEIEQHSRRNDWHYRAAERDPDSLLFQIAGDAVRRRQPERAAAREQDGVNPVHRRRGREQVGLARAGRGAANVYAAPPRLPRTPPPCIPWRSACPCNARP